MPENQFCTEHGQCIERVNNACKDIEDLKCENTQLKKDIQNMKIEQIKDSERVINLYNVVGEIKAIIKEISDKLDAQAKKPDSIKEIAFEFFKEALKYALVAGIVFYIMQMAK